MLHSTFIHFTRGAGFRRSSRIHVRHATQPFQAVIGPSDCTALAIWKRHFASGDPKSNSTRGGSASTCDDIKFYDRATNHCSLCNCSVAGMTYVVHRCFVEHSARVAIIERGVALVKAHIESTGWDTSKSSHRRSVAISRTGRQGSLQSNSGSTSSRGCCAPVNKGGGVGDVGLRVAPLLPSLPVNKTPTEWTPKEIVDALTDKFWTNLQPRPYYENTKGTLGAARSYLSDTASSMTFGRVPELSSNRIRERMWRLRFLLRFLKEIGALRDCLTLVSGQVFTAGTFARTARFERGEMIGDNIMKVVIKDRLHALFPPHEGGLCGSLGQVQFMIDSNSGLLAIYDYLHLDELTGTCLPNSKTKSDVIESLFGELQTYIWACKVYCGVESYAAVPDREFSALCDVVEHVLGELAHVVVMWRVEETLRNAQDMIAEWAVGKDLERRDGSSGRARDGRSFDSNLDDDEDDYSIYGHRRGSTEQEGGAAEEHLDRSRYDALPLLTSQRRRHPAVPKYGRNAWFYATHIAPTRACPQQESLRSLQDAPAPRVDVPAAAVDSDTNNVVEDRRDYQTILLQASASASLLDATSSTAAEMMATLGQVGSGSVLKAHPSWLQSEVEAARVRHVWAETAAARVRPERVAATLIRELHKLSEQLQAPAGRGGADISAERCPRATVGSEGVMETLREAMMAPMR